MKERISNIEKSKRFQELKRLTGDPKCGDHNILQDPHSGELIMRKVYMANDPKTAQRYFDKFDARTMRNFPFLVQCYDFSFQIQSEFCSKYYVLQVYYEYPYDDLERGLVVAMKNSKPYPHEELMTLFYHVLEALSHLQTVSVGYGYLQLYSIFKDNESGWYKLIDNFSSLGLREFYFNLMTSSNQPTKLFAPEILAHIYKPHSQPPSFSKADTFHLGLILLALGTLHPLNDIYDFERCLINSEKLNAHVRAFEARYASFNPLLVEILHQLLVMDAEKRASPTELKAFFPSYEHFKAAIQGNSNGGQVSPPGYGANPFAYKFQFGNK